VQFVNFDKLWSRFKCRITAMAPFCGLTSKMKRSRDFLRRDPSLIYAKYAIHSNLHINAY